MSKTLARSEQEEIIRKDLSGLGGRDGLRDDLTKIGTREFIGTNVLPGGHARRAALYQALILSQLQNIPGEQYREAVYVGLNRREGYEHCSGSGQRLVKYGLTRGWKVHTDRYGKRDCKPARNYWDEGRAILAKLIVEQIARHDREDTWDELLADSESATAESVPSTEPTPDLEPITTPSPSAPNPFRPSLAIVLAVMMVAALTSIVVAWKHADRASSDQALPAQITYPIESHPPAGVPRTDRVEGRGQAPAGRHLWVFVYGEESYIYYPQAVNEKPGSKWIVTGVNYGLKYNYGLSPDVGSWKQVHHLLTAPRRLDSRASLVVRRAASGRWIRPVAMGRRPQTVRG